MKPLSEVVQGISPCATSCAEKPSTSSVGSISEDGRTISPLAPARQSPLTGEQLTEIASLLLRAPLQIKSTKRTLYGRKMISDGARDSYYAENEPIGEEVQTEVTIGLNPDCPLPMINAALAISPRKACLGHITRLIIHKKFGSSDADRKILLNDYVAALAGYPEFVIYLACKHFWEDDRRPFIPYIAEMKDVCEELKLKIEGLKPMTMIGNSAPEPKPVFYTDPRDNPQRRVLCDFLVSAGHDDYFEKTRFFSNYQLEMLAKTFGFSEEPVPEAPKPWHETD